jgi:hypothetical protein
MPLDSSAVDSLGRVIARRNETLIAEIDSLFHAGAFGSPGLEASARDARRSFRYRCLTFSDLLLPLVTSRDTIYVTRGDVLHAPYNRTFLHAGVFPLPFLERSAMGRGRFCIRYRFPGETEPLETLFQNHRVSARVKRESIRSWNGLCLRVRAVSPDHDEVDVLYQDVYAGTLRREVHRIDGQSVEIVYLDDVQGMYVSRWGKHRVGAVALWRSLVEEGALLPKKARFGSRLYFPDIQLTLPLFLPDLGFHDLRRIEYPQPLVTRAFLEERSGRYASWLLMSEDGFFYDWREEGPVPEPVERSLPDL